MRKVCIEISLLLTNFYQEPFPRQFQPDTLNSLSFEFVKHSRIHTLFSLTFNEFSPTSYEDALKRSNCLHLKTSSLYLLTYFLFQLFHCLSGTEGGKLVHLISTQFLEIASSQFLLFLSFFKFF